MKQTSQRNLVILVLTFLFISSFSIAQTVKTTTAVKPVMQADLPTLMERVTALENKNKDLQAELDKLKTAEAADYKLLDYSFGQLKKKGDDNSTKIDDLTNKASGNSTFFTITVTPEGNSACPNCREKVMIDNSACNGNPGAKIFFTYTPKYALNNPNAIEVDYNTADGRWYFERQKKVFIDLKSYLPDVEFLGGDVFKVMVGK